MTDAKYNNKAAGINGTQRDTLDRVLYNKQVLITSIS